MVENTALGDHSPSYPLGFRMGRWVSLEPVGPADYELIARLESEPPADIFYRNMAMTPSPPATMESLWAGVAVQFVVHRREDGAPVGVVAIYNPNFRHSHAYFAVHIFPEFQGLAWPLEAAVLLLNYAFFNFPLRKLYADILDENLPHLRGRGVGSVLREEARLVGHYYVGGGPRDRITLAVHRDDWIRSTYWPGPRAAAPLP